MVEDARRNEVQDEFLAAHVHRVTRVVSALIAGDDRKSRGHEIDDLAFAFVTPLRAEHDDVHRLRILRTHFHEGSSRLTVRELTVSTATTLCVAMNPVRYHCRHDRIERPRPDHRSTRGHRRWARGGGDRGGRPGASAGGAAGRRCHRPMATLPSTASTPGLGLSPKRGFRATKSPSFRSTCSAATPPASVSRCRFAPCARRWRCAPTSWPKGSPAFASRHSTRWSPRSITACIRACPAAGRSAPAATSRRSPTSPSCSLAKARYGMANAPLQREAHSPKPGSARLSLGAKEGLALINGTQVSAAVAALAIAGAERLARAADVAAALSIDALQGSVRPFDGGFTRLARSRDSCSSPTTSPGSSKAAASTCRTPIAVAFRMPTRMRCAPQVHGAARDALTWVHDVVRIEMNAATDNPMVFADTEEIVSGGNFHGAPVAIACRSARHRARPTGHDQRTPLRTPRQSGAERPAGVPHPPWRAAIGPDDRPGDRRGAHLRAQDTGASRQRRHDPDVGEQGRSRQHEHGGGIEGGTRLAAGDHT